MKKYIICAIGFILTIELPIALNMGQVRPEYIVDLGMLWTGLFISIAFTGIGFLIGVNYDKIK